MRWFRSAFGALALAAGLAVVAAPAGAALPEIKSNEFPVTATGIAIETNVAELSTALAAPITASEAKVTLTFSKAGDNGVYAADFTGAKLEKEQCTTPGSPAGTVLISGVVNLVIARKASGISEFGGAFMVPKEFTIECGPLGKPFIKVSVSGTAIGEITGVVEGFATSAASLKLKCTLPNNGKQELKELENDFGGFEKAILKANLGLGSEAACEEVKSGFLLSFNKPVEFLNI